jgi:hypothetical protein
MSSQKIALIPSPERQMAQEMLDAFEPISELPFGVMFSSEWMESCRDPRGLQC